ncbi:hypothetical protein NDU88_004877 [Pleurodeles waltl]|uniref:Uncharacterized protein n=1 Tax=Pleurodeles waltl TaxID=8319 RepID=A0AAV7LVY0_PLEWA|nr:hypothetical protein NDU88_004877 [Pleurodeles waltl]
MGGRGAIQSGVSHDGLTTGTPFFSDLAAVFAAILSKRSPPSARQPSLQWGRGGPHAGPRPLLSPRLLPPLQQGFRRESCRSVARAIPSTPRGLGRQPTSARASGVELHVVRTLPVSDPDF